MREIILEERRKRLERFITKVKTKEPPPHLRRRWADELIDLYVGYLRANNKGWPDSASKENYQHTGSADQSVLLYQHEPVSRRATEMKELLERGDLVELANRLDRLASSEEGQEIESEMQSIIAKRKHKHGPYEELLDQIYKSNPFIGHKELYQILLGQVGKGVIKYIDSQHGLIVLEDGREFAVSGLKDQIYKRRREM
jgi:hypothetical protein